MRPEEPVGHDAVLGHAVEDAVGADDRRIDGPRQDQEADHDDEGVEQQPGPAGPIMFIARPPIKLPSTPHAHVFGNEQDGQEADAHPSASGCRRKQ